MITPPNWCRNAVPTLKGWADPKTGELLVARKISQDDIDEHNNVKAYGAEPVVEVIEQMYGVPEEAPQMLHEAPVNNVSLEDMTKRELLALGEQHGIELSRFATKKKLIERLESEL